MDLVGLVNSVTVEDTYIALRSTFFDKYDILCHIEYKYSKESTFHRKCYN